LITNSTLLEKKYRSSLIFIRFILLFIKFVNIYPEKEKLTVFLFDCTYLYTV